MEQQKINNIIPSPVNDLDILIDNMITKRLSGLIRINHDLDNVALMIKMAIQNRKLNKKFVNIDYQGIIVTYRKCFTHNNGRKARLHSEICLKKATQEQMSLHSLLHDLGDRYIAHAESDAYDIAHIYIVLDENNFEKAVDIKIVQYLISPIADQELDKILDLVNFLKNDLNLEIENLRKKIVHDYNNSKIKISI